MTGLARLDELQQFRQTRPLTDDELREAARIHADLGDRAAATACLREVSSRRAEEDPQARIDVLLQRYAAGELDAAGAYSLADLLRQTGQPDQAEQVAAWAARRYALDHPPTVPWHQIELNPNILWVVFGVLAVWFLCYSFASASAGW